MEMLARIITSHIVRAIKSVWYKIKMRDINAKLDEAKKEAKNAKEISGKLSNDFKSEYEQYLRSKSEDDS